MIPAWKRLGLKLQNSDQSSEVHVPKNQDSQHDESPRERVDVKQSPSQTTVHPIESKKSQLGKRKHEQDPAETNKKSKISEHPNNDKPAIQEAPSPAVHVEESAAVSKPKGDSNYRKKKNQRNGKHAAADASLRVPNTKVKGSKALPRTPSLSPGIGSTLLASTETDYHEPPRPQNSSSSPPPARTDRRKSVTFTPDTKKVDGNSASNLFKKWVQEQKTTEEFTEAEVAQFEAPPKVHPANDVPPSDNKDAKKAKKSKKSASTSDSTPASTEAKGAPAATETIPAITTTNPKKDPSIYLNYLETYHTDRPNWKFNKAKQNDVLANALNIFRIPESHSAALIAYVQGLQGAGVIQRLREQCITALDEIEAAGGTDSDMDDPAARKAAQDEALKTHLSKQRKRRRLDRDVENLVGHPHGENYVRRMKKGRAEALLKALGMAMPAPAPAKALPERVGAVVDQKPARKRNRRTEDVSSDESSDSSSSEESSEEESSSDSESDEDSGSDASATSSDSDSESDSSSSDED